MEVRWMDLLKSMASDWPTGTRAHSGSSKRHWILRPRSMESGTDHLQEQQQNNQQYWLVGINTCGREVYMIMPGNYSSTKVETEKKKNDSLYFQNLFL